MTPALTAALAVAAVLVVAATAVVAYRAGAARARDRMPSARALFAGLADADAVDAERRMLAMLEEAVVVADVSGAVLVANEAAVERGIVVDGMLADDAVRALVDEAAQRPVDRELTLVRGADRMHVAATAQLTTQPAAPGRITLVCADTGYRRSVDRVRRDFVTNVSHELKTPVGAIMLLAETIGDAGDDVDMIRHFAARIGVEAKRLDGLVRRLIELGRMNAGGERSAAAVDVRGLVAQAIADTEVTAAARHAVVRLRDAAADMPLPVEVDAAGMRIAFKNIIENAINYSPEGAVVAVELSRAGDEACIRVVDHGVGIPQQLQGRVFERFYRVDPARSRLTGGTGLGLSIANHHVRANHGRITLWSRPGEGSTFTVALPLAQNAAAPDGPEAADAPDHQRKEDIR
ncbi:Signal transduction histidine kinase [Bifidobacterium italicum]|uniref:Sensor-like histidine kinase SenX3 n=1 Tax=Bifidobacterium italicum TaxID=1960968 RepID=A0A2A2EN20_9BIFI|nr:ATP-binding protein [Bifidobacterium italicum]PAU70186.1 Signal transduction histidine kinase [Bifidobacterium italicum]